MATLENQSTLWRLGMMLRKKGWIMQESCSLAGMVCLFPFFRLGFQKNSLDDACLEREVELAPLLLGNNPTDNHPTMCKYGAK
jgi:hypothetical protein